MSRHHKFQEQEVLLQGLSEQVPQQARDLLLLWHKFAQPGQMPTRKEFTPENLKPWLQDISIFEYIAEKDDFQILLEGENIVALTGDDWRGAFAREVDCHFSTSVHAALSAARTTGMPQIHEFQILQNEWRSGIRLLLPVLRQIEGQKDVCQVFLAIFPTPE